MSMHCNGPHEIIADHRWIGTGRCDRVSLRIPDLREFQIFESSWCSGSHRSGLPGLGTHRADEFVGTAGMDQISKTDWPPLSPCSSPNQQTGFIVS